jgi:hypothetical protein
MLTVEEDLATMACIYNCTIFVAKIADWEESLCPFERATTHMSASD